MVPLISFSYGVTGARLFYRRSQVRVEADPERWQDRKIEFEEFLGDNASAVEGVVEPEVRGERVMGDAGDDAVFEEVPGGEAEDADGFDADVLRGGSVGDGR